MVEDLSRSGWSSTSTTDDSFDKIKKFGLENRYFGVIRFSIGPSRNLTQRFGYETDRCKIGSERTQFFTKEARLPEMHHYWR